MSDKKVDSRVVEMKFDNKNFEKNVKQSMDSIDSLNKKLKFKDSSKGFNNISKAAKKCNVSGVGTAVDKVKVKFSAMEVIGVTALANITNSAVNAGKRIADALTIAPIRTGFSEYELKMNSIQTMLMSSGESLETVNKYLEELNEYSDRTIYSFSDMTSNIGKFTNAGVKLKDAVAAIKGISNEAAISGANANEAARAMYNFSQALGTGFIQRIDWKSIELANMATIDFKQNLLDTAISMGTMKKTQDGYITSTGKACTSQSAFIDVLDEQWLTSEVLIETLKKYTDETTELGKKAYEASSQVKTFTQMCGVLQETAQSGWAMSWEIIFGDFNKAKTTFTTITDTIGAIIQQSSDARNAFLKNALNSNWQQLTDKVQESGLAVSDFQTELIKTAKDAGVPIDALTEKYGTFEKTLNDGWLTSKLVVDTLKKFTNQTQEATVNLEELQAIAKRVMNGEFGNGKVRVDALTKAGYDYASVQSIVNNKLLGTELNIKNLSDTQMKNMGYTDEQIKAFRELENQIGKTGTPLNDLINEMDKISGRELLIGSVTNIINAIQSVFGPLKKGFDNVFSSSGVTIFYNFLKGLESITSKLILGKELTSALEHASTGFFSIVKTGINILGGITNAAGTLMNTLSPLVGVVVKFSGLIGDLLKGTAERIDITGMFGGAFSIFNDIVGVGVDVITTFAGISIEATKMTKTFFNVPTIFRSISTVTKEVSVQFNNAAESFSKWIKSLKNVSIIESFGKVFGVIGLGIQNVAESIADFSTKSTGKFESITGNIIKLGQAIKEKLDLNSLLSIVNAIMFAINQFMSMKLLDALTQYLKRGRGIQDGFAKILNSVSEAINRFNKETRSDKLLKTAKALGLLAASLFVLSKIKPEEIKVGLAGMGALIGELILGLGVLNVVLKKWPLQKGMNKLIGPMLGFASSMLILSYALKVMSGLSWDQLARGLVATGVAMTEMIIMSKAMKSDLPSFKAFASSMLVLAAALKILGGIKPEELEIGFIALGGAMLTLSLGVRAMSTENGRMNATGKQLIAISMAMMSFATALKIMGSMSTTELGIALTGLAGSMLLLASAVKIMTSGNNLAATGGQLMAISVAVLSLTYALKSMSQLSVPELVKGITALAFAMGIMATAVRSMTSIGGGLAATGGQLMAISVAIIALATGLKLMSTMSVGGIAKSLTALAVSISILVGASLALSGCIVPLMAFSKAVLMFGAGIGLIGVGLLAFSAGLAALVTTVTINQSQLLIALKGLIDMVPVLIDQFMKAMRKYVPSIVENFVIMIVDTLNALAKHVPKLLPAIANLINAIVESINDAIKSMDVDLMLKGIKCISLIVVMAKMLSFLPALMVPAMKGIALAGVLMLEIAAVLAIIGGLEQISGVSEFVQSGGKLLGAIGTAIGSFVGGIVGGFGKGVSDSLPAIGKNLSEFMKNVNVFIVGAKGIKGDAVEGIKNLAKVFLDLKSIQNGGKLDMSGFVEQAEGLGPILEGFADGISGITEDTIKKISLASKALVEIIKASQDIPNSGGVAGYWAGENDIGPFVQQLSTVGKDLMAFSNDLKGFTPEMATGITEAMKSISEIIEVANTIPNSGGSAGFWAGENDMGPFIAQLRTVGKDLISFGTDTQGLTKDMTDSIANTMNCISSIIKISNTIPNSGGLKSLWSGDDSIMGFVRWLPFVADELKKFAEKSSDIDTSSITTSMNSMKCVIDTFKTVPTEGSIFEIFKGKSGLTSFASGLKDIGKGLSNYSNSIKDLDSTNVIESCYPLKNLITAFATIPSDGGFLELLKGKADLSSFGSGLSSIGKGLKKYSENIKDLNTPMINLSAPCITKLVSALSICKDKSMPNVTKFADGLKALGPALEQFSKNVYYVSPDKMTAIAPVIERLAVAANSIATVNVEQLQSFVNSFSTLGSTTMDTFVNGFANKEDDIVAIISKIFGIANNTIDSNTVVLVSAVKACFTSCVNASNGLYDNFVKIGKYIPKGLKKGIEDATPLATAAASGMASAVEKASRFVLKVKSPSRAFMAIGKYVGEGFAIGISNSANDAVAASSEMASLVANICKGTFEEMKGSLSLAEAFDEITLDGKIAVWEDRVKKLKEGTEDYWEAEKTLYGLYKEKAEAQWENDRLWAENKVKANEMTLKDQLWYNRELQRIYKEQKDKITILKQEEIDLIEQMEEESYNNSKDWISKQDSLITKYFGAKRVMKRYASNTDEYKEQLKAAEEYRKEITKLTKDYYDDRLDIKKDFITQSESLEKTMEDNIKNIKTQLKNDIDELNKTYDDALKSRTDALYKAYGLFDEVAEFAPVDGADLLTNLEDQVASFKEWEHDINALARRGISGALLGELREMGPSSAAQIDALNNMTSTELNSYVDLWQEKYNLANKQASFELSDLRDDTDSQIKQLRKDANIEIQKAVDQYNEDLNQLNVDTQNKLDDLYNTWMVSMGLMKEDVGNEVTEMVDNIINTMGEQSQWSETGGYMVEGVVKGIENKSSELYRKMEELSIKALEHFNDPIEIASPSKKFKESGMFCILGFVKGLEQYANQAYSATTEVGSGVLSGMQTALSMATDMANTDTTFRPTIAPVLDLSNIQNGANSINGLLGVKRSLSLGLSVGQINNRSNDNYKSFEDATVSSNGKIAEAIDGLKEDIATLAGTMREMKIVMDTGTLVGAITPEIDNSLGRLSIYKNRGM